jgi:multidrug efflux pump
MISLAFILGMLPLAVAPGAGSGAQNAIGITVLGGMLAATLLGIFFVPPPSPGSTHLAMQ